MKRLLFSTLLLLFPSSAAHAQWTVYDPTNYVQALSRYEQLVRIYDVAAQAARRLPADLRRYRAPEVPWMSHDTRAVQAVALLEALNAGDATGQRYRESIEPLELLDLAVAQAPESLRARLSAGYRTIELADSVASSSFHHAGTARSESVDLLSAIRALETDTFAVGVDYHSQTALLDKLTGAALIGLRLQEQASQLSAHVLEHAIVEGKRKRDTEASVMNARIHQWRHGTEYAEGLVRQTAERLDAWRQP